MAMKRGGFCFSSGYRSRAMQIGFLILMGMLCSVPLANAASISGTMFESDGTTPVTVDWFLGTYADVYVKDACGYHYIATGEVDDTSGTYTVTGLAAGQYYLKAFVGESNYIEEWWADPQSTPDDSAAQAITVDFAKDALKDLIALQEKLVTIENIQKTVAEYYKIRVSELLSKKRTRSIARPRQLAMALAKELTNHSLPEIGDAFGGRDHTTVLHACRKIEELKISEVRIMEDYSNLIRTLSS